MALSLDFAASHSSGGRYPPLLFRGARTFLGLLAKDAAARPPGGVGLGNVEISGKVGVHRSKCGLSAYNDIADVVLHRIDC